MAAVKVRNALAVRVVGDGVGGRRWQAVTVYRSIAEGRNRRVVGINRSK